MQIQFYKYQGTGNDFLIVDAMPEEISFSENQIRFLCDRHFGVGADGLMLIQPSDVSDFRMLYFNADGKESSMCGNGGRCIAQFAESKKYAGNEMSFTAIDGIHKAIIKDGTVSLQMQDVSRIRKDEQAYILDTGSPHYVLFVPDAGNMDINYEGRKIRNSSIYKKEGINVNFAQINKSNILVRTYERGVEGETLSCGTGVTAVAIASHASGIGKEKIDIQTIGGNLTVSFRFSSGIYSDIWLTGPAEFIFKAEITI
jgi:diaminopimelate epimerase